ncbi:MAG: CDP-diacylglycerol--glycerol-3-phosphate 3-phosphatidyltransferase [Clostridia bacterium]|nr:CDP-diacylglycerol--glycerol-3-phosphate 3-phosphatidyltransferase [Clostridia bacterium]
MNIPNRLTILRILLVPVCLLLAGYDQRTAAAIVFALACVTDTLDGHIARKKKLITNFGKFADPIADKILVLSMMIVLCYKHLLPVWLPVILVFRELLVDGLRMVAAEQGRVVAAGWSGKIKTVCQMLLIIYALLFGYGAVTLIFSIVVAGLTLYSGCEYFWKLRDLFAKDLGL